MLSEIIGEEQFGFLQNRKIHDVIFIAQEVLHSVKKKKLKSRITETGPFKSLRQSWLDLFTSGSPLDWH
jgi:hypothetical protein